MAKALAKGSRISGAQRTTLAAQYAKRYASGESIRKIADDAGRSYGFVHDVLKESGVSLRGRGGATRGAKKTAASGNAADARTPPSSGYGQEVRRAARGEEGVRQSDRGRGDEEGGAGQEDDRRPRRPPAKTTASAKKARRPRRRSRRRRRRAKNGRRPPRRPAPRPTTGQEGTGQDRRRRSDRARRATSKYDQEGHRQEALSAVERPRARTSLASGPAYASAVGSPCGIAPQSRAFGRAGGSDMSMMRGGTCR